MTDPDGQKRCPKCGASNPLEELPTRAYRCGDCGLELAHLDLLPTGGLRGLHGWLLDIDAVVHDRYRVMSVLGKGGFGVTYLVNDNLLHGKRRALKEVPALLFDEYETRLLGHLNHPAIPDISDRFEAAGMVYQVLEFGGDRTLRMEKERRGDRIPLFVLLPWMRQLCEVLQYLHQQNPPVVHRDLKPENVLLDEHDRVMLIDFGIAKEATSDTATRTIGRAVSEGFSPPEQVLGTGTDARSDVYALGAIQYYCLTGNMPPAAHERITGTALEPISKSLPEMPPLIEAAVMQALELNINFRQQSIAELASVFEMIQAESGSAPTISVAAATACRTATGEANLPSVQINSGTITGKVVSPQSMRVHVTTDTRAPELQTPRPRRNFATSLAAIVLPISLAGAGGYWWWLEYGSIPGAATPTQRETPSDQGPDPDLGEQSSTNDVLDARTAEHPAESAKIRGTATSADTPNARTGQPATQSASATALNMDGTPTPQLDPRPDPVAPDPVAIDESSVAEGTEAAAAVVGAGTAMAAMDSQAKASKSMPTAPLPSIFSDEQPTPKAPIALPPANGGATTLFDLFERQRKTALSAPSGTPDAPSAPTKAEPPKTTTPAQAKAKLKPVPKKRSTQPAPKRKVAVAPKPRPKPRPKPKPKASGSSDWGFQYKGARKTD